MYVLNDLKNLCSKSLKHFQQNCCESFKVQIVIDSREQTHVLY